MGLYPEIEPYDRGMLEVDGGHALYWETCGDPAGKPAVVLHGGPGSGCTPWHRRFFDPGAYRIVLFDQRGCGRSRPHASAPDADLSGNDTAALVRDLDLLRGHLGIERWLVWGGSWGSTLALAYAEAHPGDVSELVLWGVTTGRRAELDWLFRGGAAVFFPEQWERLRAALPESVPDEEVVDAYHRLLLDPDPDVHQAAAAEWCLWESATAEWPPRPGLSPRFEDPSYALAFARIVTHYVRHDAWLEDGALLTGADALAGIPGTIVNGRFDLQAPPSNAWRLSRAWPGADLVVVEHEGHSPTSPALADALVGATDRFAAPG